MENEEIKEQPQQEEANVTEVKEEKTEQVTENDTAQKNEKSVADIQSCGSLGKFKDAESLYSAYNNLQAEFTRKCQRLSELEKENSQTPLQEKNTIENYIQTNQSIRNQIITSYLEDLQKNQPPKLISSCVGSEIPMRTPPKPTNLEEAKQLVSALFE